MNALAETGFVVLGGPLGDGSRILLIVDAGSEQEVRRRLAEDPWSPTGLLTVTSVEPWQILLDADHSRTRPERRAKPVAKLRP